MRRLIGIDCNWAQMTPAQLEQPRMNLAGLEMENPYQEMEMDSPFVDTHEYISYSP